MYLSHEQEAISTAVKTVSDLTVPANATHCELQAVTNNINYTMDNSTDPTAGAGGVGMVLRTTDPPKAFLIEDLRRGRFIRGAAADAVLAVHYFAGRDV